MGYGIIVVGTSLGGLYALGTLLRDLPPGYPVPLAVVQHRSVESQELLARELQRQTRLRIVEPSDGDPVAPGAAYVAPADYHLLVDGGRFRLSTEGAVNHARPSADVLFLSAADAYGPETLAVVLTGASADGAAGCAAVRRAGGVVVVQSPEEAECPVMPRAALKATATDKVWKLNEIRNYLLSPAVTGAR